MSNASDFVIENGVLTKYVGSGGAIEFPAGVNRVTFGVFDDAAGEVTDITFPGTNPEVPTDVCYCLWSLNSISIAEGVTKIGDRAFFSCEKLVEAGLPKSLQEIGCAAFSDCKKLQKISLPQNLKIVGERAFQNCCEIESIGIPAGVTEIGSGAFSGCKTLREVQVPEGVTELAWGVFSGCEGVETVGLPHGLKKIGEGCFGGCKSLHSIQIPESVTAIGDHAFSGCKNLKEITLPATLEAIGKDTFSGCAKNLKVFCSGTIFKMLSKQTKDNTALLWLSGKAEYEEGQTDAIKKYIGRIKNRLFTEIKGDDDMALTRLLSCGTVKPEFLEAYMQKYNDGQHPKMMAVLLNYQDKNVSDKEKEELSDKALGLTEKTAKDWANVYRWTVEDGGIVITKYKGINPQVDIPDQIDGLPVIKIGKNAFKGNTQVQKVHIPDTITDIMESAFEKCESLSEVRLSENLQTIRKRAFFSCQQLGGTLVLPQKVTSVGYNAFCQCALAALHISAGVKKLSLCMEAGALYIHGKDTELDAMEYYNSPIHLHAHSDSRAAALKEFFDSFTAI